MALQIPIDRLHAPDTGVSAASRRMFASRNSPFGGRKVVREYQIRLQPGRHTFEIVLSYAMSDGPLVSVFMPVHHGAQYLHEAPNRALAQKYSPIDVIVVDDGSTDRTPEVLRSFGERITALRQNNAGAAVARNTAMQLAKGEFLAFLDADNLCCPTNCAAEL